MLRERRTTLWRRGHTQSQVYKRGNYSTEHWGGPRRTRELTTTLIKEGAISFLKDPLSDSAGISRTGERGAPHRGLMRKSKKEIWEGWGEGNGISPCDGRSRQRGNLLDVQESGLGLVGMSLKM